MQIRILLAAALLSIAGALHAADIDMKLNSADGTTKMSVLDSGSVEVSSITSDGHAYFTSVAITTGNVSSQMTIGDVMIAGSVATNSDSYVAIPMTAGAAIATKQAVVLNTAGQVATNTTNSTNTIVGVTVTSTAGVGKIYVAVSGVVNNVTCQAALAQGQIACNGGTTAGRVGVCTNTTTPNIVVGRMITACTAGGTGTMLVQLK